MMKLLLVLVSVCLACVAAQTTCNELGTIKMRQQWHYVYGYEIDRTSLGIAVWKAFFKQVPEARSLFERVHGEDVRHPEFVAHSARVLGGLDSLITLAEHHDIFAAQQQHLAAFHAPKNIPGAYFEAFKRATLTVAEGVAQRCFDKQLWSDCLDIIGDI